MDGMSASSDLSPIVQAVLQLARRAGAAILEVYASVEQGVTRKADDSPLTLADLRAHQILFDGLRQLTPDVPVLSEEAADVPFEVRSRWPRYWLVDPLDGTKEFLARNGEFTVNVALIDGHEPILGVVHVPVTGVDYWGLRGDGAWRRGLDGEARRIAVQREPCDVVRVAGSRSHRGDSLAPFLARLGAHEFVPMGSSLKFCVVAEGGADVYPRLGPTSEWDTAAAHAVLAAAGGSVVTTLGAPLRYNTRPELLNPSFVAYGSASRDWVELLQPPQG
jgi:3'(2'), 5'-bisphosphate nucleotidase